MLVKKLRCACDPCAHISVITQDSSAVTGWKQCREGHRSIQKLHLPRLQEILSRKIGRAACNVQATCTNTLSPADAEAGTSATAPPREAAPFGLELVALCQQLKQLQEAATAVCELLVTQQNILQASGDGSCEGPADAQVHRC